MLSFVFMLTFQENFFALQLTASSIHDINKKPESLHQNKHGGS